MRNKAICWVGDKASSIREKPNGRERCHDYSNISVWSMWRLAALYWSEKMTGFESRNVENGYFIIPK